MMLYTHFHVVPVDRKYPNGMQKDPFVAMKNSCIIFFPDIFLRFSLLCNRSISLSFPVPFVVPMILAEDFNPNKTIGDFYFIK